MVAPLEQVLRFGREGVERGAQLRAGLDAEVLVDLHPHGRAAGTVGDVDDRHAHRDLAGVVLEDLAHPLHALLGHVGVADLEGDLLHLLVADPLARAASGCPPYSSSMCCAFCSADCSDALRPAAIPPVSFTLAVTSTATPFSSHFAYFV